MKVAVLGNQARAMRNFWTVLIRDMLSAGHEVVCLLPEPDDADRAWEASLLALGARIAHYPLERKGMNPLRDLRTLLALRRLFKQERFARLFAYTIKPVIYGPLASALAGSPAREHRALMVTGLGYMFEGDTLFKRLLTQLARFLYRLAFSRAGLVFFQNDDDYALFRQLSIIPQNISVRMSKGCGVDADHFSTDTPPGDAPVFLYVGRLLEAKGLRDLAQATRLLRERHPGLTVNLLGPEEPGPGGIAPEELRGWEVDGLVRLLGEAADVRPWLSQSTVVVLPSWREGTPTALLEAMSMGRAVIATDVPGCREVVRPGRNGFLVPPRSPLALAEAMEACMGDPEQVRRMGRAGREMAAGEFSASAVAANIMREMRVGSGI